MIDNLLFLIILILVIGIVYTVLKLIQASATIDNLKRKLRNTVTPAQFNELFDDYKKLHDESEQQKQELQNIKKEHANILKLYEDAKKKPTKPKTKPRAKKK